MRLGRRVTTALLALAVAAVPLPTDAATAPSYVALGDSYSSGVGTRTYLADGTTCQRSVYAYPSLIAAARGYALTFRACSGTTVANVRSSQLSALGTGTAYVTISVGGNDAGFSSVLTECAKPGWLSSCNAAVDRAQAVITGTLPASLHALFASIRSLAPNAAVVVAGYPRLFNGEDCNLFTWFSPSEETRLNQTADLLDARLGSAATAVGFSFANPTSAFVGHAVCGSPEWLNGLSYPVSESYHPNRTGHASGYTPLVGPRLTGAAVALTASVLQAARASATTLAAQQRAYADLDSTIRPERVRPVDLHSPRALRVAQRLGIDVNDRASVDAADRRWSARQARAWERSVTRAAH